MVKIFDVDRVDIVTVIITIMKMCVVLIMFVVKLELNSSNSENDNRNVFIKMDKEKVDFSILVIHQIGTIIVSGSKKNS